MKKFVCCLLLTWTLNAYAESYTTIGSIKASSASRLSSQVSGRVDKILVDIGDPVKRGQPLVELETRYLVIDRDQKLASFESARIDHNDAELNYQRMQKLWHKPEGQAPSISLKRLEEAKSQSEHAASRLKQAAEALKLAELNLEEAQIKAPYDGVITNCFIDSGESILGLSMTPLMEIQAVDPVYLEFSIPQGQLNLIEEGTPIDFAVEGLKEDHFQAHIDKIYPNLDESTRSVLCRAVIANSDRKIRTGSLAKVTIKGN